MKLRDTLEDGPPEAPDELWELIPWYVNGSLPADEMEAVRQRMEDSPAFADEVRRQTTLAKEVATSDPFEAPTAASWDKLRAQIEAERSPAAAPQTPPRGNVVDISAWLGRLQGNLLPAGLAVAAGLALVLLVLPTDDGFRTLTGGGAEGASIRFQPAEGVAMAELDAILEARGLVRVSGPSEAGVYTAAPKVDGAAADLESLSAALKAAPEILFAAPGGSE